MTFDLVRCFLWRRFCAFCRLRVPAVLQAAASLVTVLLLLILGACVADKEHDGPAATGDLAAAVQSFHSTRSGLSPHFTRRPRDTVNRKMEMQQALFGVERPTLRRGRRGTEPAAST